ncbi:hypothetical protein LR48_Vigan10g053800 [Vigna angularis]|uniref:Uncharacterized protein n=2 Tax=Phaseolus angularis TaxID=3914 RepID=A0A0S3TBI3_PHAAN|nr:putative UPF0481 protein At3g02645 [Vigna angularis]KAG2384964.1 putative UPF0481 protein [Vigna angularis]KOM54646.1 hypothetical protein LR48_Vigan10g053800 [Vigna angularis]BAU02521.1 hypothetical protein VIGAN_11206900 [Vigna angularis var. angularis]
MDSPSIFSSESDEDCWIIRVNEIVSETHHSVLKRIPVCIFHVPKTLSCGKPEAFTPQFVAIGPYTHFRPELYPMERIKIFAAKAVLDHFKKHELKQVIQEFRDTATFIRASYHKHLCLKDETLLYTVAIDAFFLLNFFHKYLNDRLSCSFMRGLGDQTEFRGLTLTKDAIVRDILMVENQIPMFSLLKILQFESSEPTHSVQEYLGSMLLSFCKQHSPLKLIHSPTCSEAVSKHCHLLDLMYHLVVSNAVNSETPIPDPSEGTSSAVQKSSNYEAIAISFKKVKGVLTWTVGSLKKLKDVNIPLGKPFKRQLDRVIKVSCQLDTLSSHPKLSEEEEEEEDVAPMIINIPCVRELHSVGVCFKPVEGGNMAIEFDETKGIFYLPVVKLDVNSEVIMRNLVAYEALTQPDFLIFTRYTELMRAIVDTVKDVKLLMKAGIIESSSSLSMEETEELFNGMSKSIGPTKAHKLDETIKKVNKYYHDKRKTNLFKASTDYVYRSWKFFTLLATFVLLAMTAIETFCAAYDCHRYFAPQ